MTPERFLALAQRSETSLDELLTMRENALGSNQIHFVHLAEQVLDERFPHWKSDNAKSGGPTPTVATFMKQEQSFETAKEAYIWLVQHFIRHHPQLFERIDDNTLYVAKGKRALYFARSLPKLFKTSPELADDKSAYARLANGWYVKLKLSNKQKLDILRRMAGVSGLVEEVDWSFHPSRGEGSAEQDNLLDSF